jgi:sugar phosphate isomerase/epimerase
LLNPIPTKANTPFTRVLLDLTLFAALNPAPIVLAADEANAGKTDRTLLKLGLQTWTFHHYTLAEAMEKAEILGIHLMQVYPGQRLGGGLEGTFDYRMTAATRARVLDIALARHLTLVSMGVIGGGPGWDPKPEEWPLIFAFAQSMGLTDISSEPPKEMLPLVYKLSRQFQITVSLHNHPHAARYQDLDTALMAIKPYESNIGICADTGHWLRAGYNPVENLRRAAGHILAVHFKDLNARGRLKAHDVPWGTGVSDAAGQIAELRRQRFAGVIFIEYEYDTESLMTDLARSIAFFDKENSK